MLIYQWKTEKSNNISVYSSRQFPKISFAGYITDIVPNSKFLISRPVTKYRTNNLFSNFRSQFYITLSSKCEQNNTEIWKISKLSGRDDTCTNSTYNYLNTPFPFFIKRFSSTNACAAS